MTNTSLDSDEARRHPKNPSQAHEDSPQLSHSGDDSARLNFCDKHVPDTKTTTKEVHDVGRPSLGDTVTVACTTYLYDTQEGCRGKKIDGTADGEEGFKFTLGKGIVVIGFEKAVLSMTTGEKRTVIIPPEEAYGDRQSGFPGLIPPKATLTLDILLIEIHKT
ncbi:hypothetical protein D8B26_005408 [Coccidioides posadasii str. Silveira]|uniref:uncharacterized protein n=1 Tax=Coccidioides posadasii (strain RMSCC 757 / Silveira) TaxID=443226 RepID=UPI001BF13954|nr:hypothetical protein D8B26_005408 [Coccidioides posadasii str. Silveira]